MLKNKITGRAKKDFYDYCLKNKDLLFNRLLADENDVLDELEYLSDLSIYPIAIEFFDTCIFEGDPLFSICFEFYYKIGNKSHFLICLDAIEKSSEIYNEYIELIQ